LSPDPINGGFLTSKRREGGRGQGALKGPVLARTMRNGEGGSTLSPRILCRRNLMAMKSGGAPNTQHSGKVGERTLVGVREVVKCTIKKGAARD